MFLFAASGFVLSSVPWPHEMSDSAETLDRFLMPEIYIKQALEPMHVPLLRHCCPSLRVLDSK